jgi:uncharacterized Zn finger protein
MARARRASQRDDVRSFPALPPTPGRRAFAESWWGKEWITALEETSMDSGRLSRGRTYARGGHVADITVSPGKITAKVHGSQPRPYKSTVYIRAFSDSEWEKLLDAVAAKAVHLAALLDRDMPQGLANDAAEAGVSLLPRANELEPECSCPDWGYPCKHAAALCYQVSRILDQDPFVLLLMRGRDEPAIMEELHRRNAAHAAREQAADEQSAVVPQARRPPRGTPAREAFAAWTVPPVPPQLPAPVKEAGLPAVFGASDDPDGVSTSALEMLAADAAVRAKVLLDAYLAEGVAASADPQPLVPALDARRDAVRLLAGDHRDVDVFARLIGAFGFEPMQMVRSILAWRFGGCEGLAVLEEPWTPPSDEFFRARASFASGWDEEEPPAFKTWRNRWTFAEHDAQLRYGRDGRWYPYRRRDGEWSPDGRPSSDPVVALTDLLDQAPGQAVSDAPGRRAPSRSR